MILDGQTTIIYSDILKLSNYRLVLMLVSTNE